MTNDFIFNDFLEKYPRYRKKFGNNTSIQEVYYFLAQPLSIDKMINANKLGMPALSGIVIELEDKFSNRKDISLNNPEIKQLIGCIVESILREFGFKSKIQRVVKNSEYFKSATHYRFDEHDTDSIKFEIVSQPSIRRVK